DPEVPLSSIAAAIGMDKKRVMSDLDMPLVTGPGSCVLRRIPVALLREDLPAIREEIRGALRERAGAAVREERRPREEEEIRPPLPHPPGYRASISALRASG